MIRKATYIKHYQGADITQAGSRASCHMNASVDSVLPSEVQRLLAYKVNMLAYKVNRLAYKVNMVAAMVLCCTV